MGFTCGSIPAGLMTICQSLSLHIIFSLLIKGFLIFIGRENLVIEDDTDKTVSLHGSRKAGMVKPEKAFAAKQRKTKHVSAVTNT
jgi:hypothetical protein